MTKLDELIQEYCPDGVEYKRLGDIATISRGGSFQKKDYTENGIPCIHYGQIYMNYGLFAEKTLSYISEETAQKQRFAESGDIIMAVTSENIDDVCKCMAWLGNEKVAVSGHTAIIRHSINPKYLVYWLHSSAFYQQKAKIAHGTKVIEVAPVKLADVILPVPPLPVQREIVRILDNFAELTEGLNRELAAELTARKKQYTYYRDKLLSTNNSSIPVVELRDIVKKSCSGATPAKGNAEYYENGTIPWIRTQDVRFNEITEVNSYVTEKAVSETATKWIPENCVIVAISGATAGRCAINKIKATTNQHCLNLIIDDSMALYRYVFHCLCSKYEELISRKQGARGDLNSSLILSLPIPIPSLEVQKRLVEVLDNFDVICTDLNIGLPAEIEARKKQYEFYRDQLLTFAAQGKTILTDRQTDRQV